jgi:hypothetical protein
MALSLENLSDSLPSTKDFSGASKIQIQTELARTSDHATITEIVFDNCTELDLEILYSINQKFPNLNSLSLQNCRNIEPHGLSTLLGQGFSSLSRVNLSGCAQCNGQNLAMVVVHRKINQLSSLRLIS